MAAAARQRQPCRRRDSSLELSPVQGKKTEGERERDEGGLSESADVVDSASEMSVNAAVVETSQL